MLKPGMFISDRYEIIDSVGSGGMADVYKAKDHRLNRFVAIKVLKPEYSSDKSFVNKFRGEAQSAAGLSHPNIVNVYDVGDDGGLYYIVMELVEGITLKRFIERKGKLDVKEAVGIAIQIAQGLVAAHDNNIIHRDIKPQNIIISRDGKVKVTDFGIAKASNSNTITSNAMGSVHYLSPEQARGGYSDEKSDIYSLGVTLYEMLSGKVPFVGDNNVSVALLHIQGEAAPLRELEEDIPLSVDKIVQKCMQKKPERRYHSASELIVDLKKSLTNPDGDFVQIPAFVTDDSPTINISDDLNKIKNGSYYNNDSDYLSAYSNNNYNNNHNNSEIIDDDEDEDEELDTVDTKMEKIFSVLTIVAIVVLFIAILFVVVRFIFPKGSKKPQGNQTATVSPSLEPTEEPTPSIEAEPTVETYQFPSVIGHKFEDAKAAILAKDPDAVIIPQEEYSSEYEAGYVVRQYPHPNTDFPVGSEVTLYVSVGPENFALPSVYNMSKAEAEQKLRENGLVPKIESMHSNDVEEGKVIRTEPAKDSLVKEGDTITVYVSLGPEIVLKPVPNLIGKTLRDAESLLREAGLRVGRVNKESSENYASGQIIYQDTTAGELVEQGTKINITVSTGPKAKPTQPPKKKYIGTLIIDDINPLEHKELAEAEVILEMEQGGYSTEIYNKRTSASDFPIIVPNIEGESASVGIVKMYIDGEVFRLNEGDQAYEWYVEFETVEE